MPDINSDVKNKLNQGTAPLRAPAADPAPLGIDKAMDPAPINDPDDVKNQHVDQAADDRSKDQDHCDTLVQKVATDTQPLGTIESSVEKIVDGIADAFKSVAADGKEKIERLAEAFKAKKAEIVTATNASTDRAPYGVGRGPLRGPTPPAAPVSHVGPQNDAAAEIMDKTGMPAHVANSVTAPGANL